MSTEADVNTSSCAASIAKVFRTKFLNNPTRRSQYLDHNQFNRLSSTLNDDKKHHSNADALGNRLPKGYHLVYFTPDVTTDALGIDGTDATYNPPSPFTRRMWAGGKMTWAENNELQLGEDVVETTECINVTAKQGKRGGEMIVVDVVKTFENERGLALTDQR
jgi:hydroxyacyl-ACP dehydratase HTD2-like protein with hotdog domain